MAVVVGLVAGLREKELTDTVVRGAGDFISVGLIIILARGVTVIMNNSMITDTVLNALESTVEETSSGAFGALMFLLNLPLAFMVPSRSGTDALAMPVLAPRGDCADVTRSLAVQADHAAGGGDRDS